MKYRLRVDKWTTLLIIFFCLVQAGIVMAFGVYDKEEAVKYIYEADFFMQAGHFSQPKYVFYSSYIFLEILAVKLHAGLIGVYIFQLLLNALATWCFFKLAFKISANRSAAYISTLLLILCIPFQKWTAYLFTESVFFSLVIIYTYLLFAQFRKANMRPILLFLLLFLLIISRPTGMLVIPASLLLASHYLWVNGKKWLLLAVWLPGLAGLALLLDTAIKGKGEFDFILPFLEGHVICGLNPVHEGSPEVTIYGEYKQGLWALIVFIFNNFPDVLRLSFLRLGAFFGMVRTHYSTLHNILLIAGFYPVYLLSCFGFGFIKRRAKPFNVFAITLIATFAASVMLTCDDWHNRFIMPVMPLIFIYAGIGAITIYNRFLKKPDSVQTV